MAYIESFFNESLGLKVISICGIVKPHELWKAIDSYYKGERANLVLFDFSDATLQGIHNDPRKRKKNASDRYTRNSDRKAFVFPSIPEQELEQILKDYCQIEKHDSSLGVFQSLVDANRWLLESQESHRRPVC